ncbi:MAG: DUF4234 domain-containing protein [Lachnospiraceae bacterium]
MRRVKDDRDFAVYLLFSILTCGIYSIFFFYDLVEDLNTVCEPMEGPDDNQKSPNYLLVLILGILTCGIYTFFWLYKQGNRIQRTGRSYGLNIDENGTTLLLWPLIGILVIGLGSVIGMYVSYFYLIKNTNKLCKAYNNKFQDGQAQLPYNNYNNYNNNNSYNNSNNYNYSNHNSYQPSVSGTLEFISGELQGTTIPLNNQENIVIGRDPSVSNIILNSKDISRRHCEIQYNAPDNCYYIFDYSSYGLRVNGQQIQKNAPVRCMPGSKISLANGRNEFILK